MNENKTNINWDSVANRKLLKFTEKSIFFNFRNLIKIIGD